MLAKLGFCVVLLNLILCNVSDQQSHGGAELLAVPPDGVQWTILALHTLATTLFTVVMIWDVLLFVSIRVPQWCCNKAQSSSTRTEQYIPTGNPLTRAAGHGSTGV